MNSEKSLNIKYFCILGERCSGTNFLEEALLQNFNLNIHSYQINKHFFGYNKFPDDTSNILFIGIIRHPFTWINSLYKYPYYIQKDMRGNKAKFLNNEFWSQNNNYEIIEDRNIYTNQRYKNIFDLRKTKLKYLYDDMPKLVDNYLLIKYEDLRDDYHTTLNLLKNNYNFQIKPNYPINITQYKGRGKPKRDTFSIDTEYIFSKEQILLHKDFDKTYEEKLGYYLL